MHKRSIIEALTATNKQLYLKGLNMRAFYKVDDLLIKAYDMGEDWKMITNDGGERWFSKWKQNEYASLHRVFYDMVTLNAHDFSESRLTLCNS